MNAKHTPGPWTLWVTGYVSEEPSLWDVMDKTQGVIGEIQSHNAADANLMVAAPDLLAALEMVLKAVDWNIEAPEDTYGVKANAAARLAIAKARGQA